MISAGQIAGRDATSRPTSEGHREYSADLAKQPAADAKLDAMGFTGPRDLFLGEAP